MEPFSIVIPYRYAEGIREDNFQFVTTYYKKIFPEAEIVIGLDDSGNEDFYRSYATNKGVAESKHDILLISDGDIFTSRESIENAMLLLHESPFVIPFGRCLDLTENKTKLIHKHGVPNKLRKLNKFKYMVRDIRPGRAIMGLDKMCGGLQLLTKDFYHEIKGYDERFKVWGYEDSWFCMKAMNRLGDYPILEDDYCYHLFHPRIAPSEGWHANEGLFCHLCDTELD